MSVDCAYNVGPIAKSYYIPSLVSGILFALGHIVSAHMMHKETERLQENCTKLSYAKSKILNNLILELKKKSQSTITLRNVMCEFVNELETLFSAEIGADVNTKLCDIVKRIKGFLGTLDTVPDEEDQQYAAGAFAQEAQTVQETSSYYSSG